MKKKNKEKGYVALIAILIIFMAMLFVSLSVSFLGLGELSMALTTSRSARALRAADSCVQDALFRLKKNAGYGGGSVTIDGASCTSSVVPSGSQRTITSSGTFQNVTRKIEMVVNLTGGKINFVSWKEIE